MLFGKWKIKQGNHVKETQRCRDTRKPEIKKQKILIVDRLVEKLLGMPQSQETQKFVGRCLEKLGLAGELTTVTGKLSPKKLSNLIARHGLVPFTGVGSTVFNLWQLSLYRGARYLYNGKVWSGADKVLVLDKEPTTNSIPLVPLGNGGFAKVFSFKLGQSDFALKKVELSKAAQENTKNHENAMKLREALVLRDINEATANHPSFLKLVDFWFTPTAFYLLTEHAGNSTIQLKSEWLLRNPIFILEITEQAFRAVDVLHSKGYLHRDLKPGNITYHLESQRLTIKLIDFGCSCAIDSEWTSSICGTPAYLGPWLYQRQRRDLASLVAADTWALLASLFALINSRNSPLHRPIIKMGGCKDWSRFSKTASDSQVLKKLELEPPKFPIPQFSQWLSQELGLYCKQTPIRTLLAELRKQRPLFINCDANRWHLEQEELAKTQTLTESSLTSTEVDPRSSDTES